MSPPHEERDDDILDAMADFPKIPAVDNDQISNDDNDTIQGERVDDEISHVLDEENPDTMAHSAIGNGAIRNRYRRLLQDQADAASEDSSSVDGLPRRAGSPGTGSIRSSLPDDSPSIHGSIISSPAGSGILPSLASRPGLNSPTPSFRPFDRRFHSRIGSLGKDQRPRSVSPAFLQTHSRNTSLGSNMLLDPNDTETTAPPWEVVRWTKLRKLNSQLFTEAGRRNFGSPTCLAVSTSIVLGTTKGIIVMFDYNQNVKMILGPGTRGMAVFSAMLRAPFKTPDKIFLRSNFHLSHSGRVRIRHGNCNLG